MPIIKVVTEVAGKVWQVDVEPGQVVEEDQTLMLIESMKMEIPLEAPEDGRVLEILVAKGDVVVEGQLVAKLEA